MFSSFGQLIGGVMQIAAQRPQPSAPTVFQTHREWAGAQPFATPGIIALAQWVINPAVHRCRIGKITLKTKA